MGQIDRSRRRAQVAVTCAALLFLAAAVAGAAERPVLRGHVPAAVAKTAPTGRLPGTNRLALAIGLPLRNREGLTILLHELYDPASPRFRQYLEAAQFAERFGPTEEDYQAVLAFAQAQGFTVRGTHPNRVLLDVTARVADIERAFGVTMRVYPHPKETRTFYAPDTEPSVEAGLPVIDISGLSDFGPPRPMLRKAEARSLAGAQPNYGSSPYSSYMGNDFRAAYVPGSALNGSNQVVGLFQLDGYYARDITDYETLAGLPNVPLQNVLLDGFSGAAGANNVEVALDIEMVISMAPGLSKIIVYEGNPSNFIPNDVLNRMATDNAAKQLSSSWSWSGGPSTSTDQILQQFATQGQSYFQASGDDDAYTGLQALDQSTHTTTPMDSPYVTAVGGTTLSTTGPGGAWVGETVWNWGGNTGSGGGISTYYAIPCWQSNVNMTAAQGSSTKRNIPDVALTADNVYVRYNNGSAGNMGGTSCAAPLWAGFAALINQQAVLGGRATVGFINPALYALGQGSNYTAVFHDVTTGNNIGTNTPGLFYAVGGYDLCTGWGTPAGVSLINALFAPIVISGVALTFESATPANGVADPGETVIASFTLKNTSGAATTNLVATLQAVGGVMAPSGPQTYGTLAAVGGASSQSFSFTASGACGSSILATLQLQDGAANLGTITFTFPLGVPVAENFDGVTAPSLPAGWTTATNGAQAKWVTSTTTNYTSPNAAFTAGASAVGVNELVTPVFTVAATTAQLSFRHKYTFQYSSLTARDGGVLEIKVGTNAFADIVTAGGSFVSGGYNYTLASNRQNPLGGRSAWGNSSSGFIGTVVNLPAAAAGQSIQLKWRCGTDSSTASAGWYVDSVSVSDAYYTCNTVVADVAVTQTISPFSLDLGQNLIYTLTLTNAGPQAAANVTATDTLPSNATFLSASAGCTYTNGTVVCATAILAAAASSSFTVTLAPLDNGPFTNAVSVATITPESVTANNSASLISTQSATMPPTIVTPPQSQPVIVGSNATINVTSSGAPPLGYQWFFNVTNLLDSTSNTLVLPSVSTNNNGGYSVIVTNDYGAATSSVATLTVVFQPSIITQPQSRTNLAGSNATFSVTATGTAPLSYRWFFNATNQLASTSNTLVLASVTTNSSGSYSVIVTNPYGTATSSVATLTVVFQPSIITQPQSQTNLIGSNTTLSVIASGTAPLDYRWFFNTTNQLASISNTLVLPSLTTNNSGRYLVIVTNPYGIVTSSVATLTVVLPPSITAQPQSQTNLAGSNTTFSVTASGTAPLSYRWFFNATNALASTSNTLVFASATTNNSGSYSVIVTNPYGTATSSVATLTVVLPPSITTQPQSQTNLVGSNITFSVTASGTAPLSYRWFFNATNALISTSNTLVLASVTTNNSGGYSVIVTNAYGTVTSSVATLTVWVPPSIMTPPQSQTVECGSSAAFTVTANGTTPLRYRWFLGTSPVPSATNASLTVTSSPTAAGPYTVVVTNVAGSVTSSVALLTTVDTTPPNITACAPNQMLEATTNCQAVLPNLTGLIAATDLCSGVTITQNPPAGTLLGLGVTNVTFTARDATTNVATCSATVTVSDTTPPTVNWHQTNILLFATPTNCFAYLPDLTGTNFILATDRCSVTVTQNIAVGTALAVGTTNLVLLAAFDPSGSTTWVTNKVIVLDNTPPSLTAPENVTVSTDLDQCFASGVALGTPVASDNCSLASVTNNAPAQFSAGVTTVTWTATDASGNIATATQTVTVLDTQPPSLPCPPDLATNTTTVQYPAPLAEDNCAVTNVACVPPSGSAFAEGVTMVNCTAQDSSGNTAACSFQVTVTLPDVQVSGAVVLEGFSFGGVRTVTFKATDATGTVRKTWDVNLSFTTDAVASFTLTNAPGATTHLSAKAAWNLRRKLGLSFTNNAAVANFTGYHLLPAGDLDNSNTVDLGDYSLLSGAWYTSNPAADIDGSGLVDIFDYFLLSSHWLLQGDPE